MGCTIGTMLRPIAAVLPCNVEVRALDEQTTEVEGFDPETMTELAGDALDSLNEEN